MEKYHHVVIGAGINGSCTAFQLAKRGTKVLLLEKFLLPHSRGSSHGQSRGIRKAYPDPFFTALMEEAYKEWEDIEKKTGVKLIKKTGLLCFAENKNIKFINDTIDSFKKVPGAQNTVYNSKQLREKFPCVRLGKSALGCYDPSGGVIFADKALKCIQDLCKEYGVVIKDGEDVEDIKHNSNSVHISTTSGSRFTAQSCVICPGPWGGPLLAKLGYQVPLKPVKIPVYY
ncbi:peroxisomal sarcosine oxidase [Eurytemora carolleeae]|uniref:peroxisomal sarcosine oxidase n=1 Tax=Eurytemora carolleeae TaxID=1294199 RepID=UPI000C764A42|nr:peroxisomal sarcosine oxidase [Eurytemora carolleeae]|eukprot:XP_023337941.1 peroxisomal sarcosine oxidase-like [Eurytemora affinis]